MATEFICVHRGTFRTFPCDWPPSFKHSHLPIRERFKS